MALSNTFKTAVTAYRMARAFPPIIPLAIGAMAVVGCAKVVTESRKAQPLTSLAGSEWGLADFPQTISFNSGGEVRGFAGCNNFFGTYVQDGQSLTFGPLASTKKLCQGKMEAEADFLKTVQNTRQYEATHLSMSFIDENGETLLQLRRKDWD